LIGIYGYLVELQKIAIDSLWESSSHIVPIFSLSSFVGMICRTLCHPATGALTTTQPERNLIIAMGDSLGHIINLPEHMCPYCQHSNNLP